MPIVRNVFQKVKVTRGGVACYMLDRSTVGVEDAEHRYIIRRAGNYQDGRHRWANFRKYVFHGSWNTAQEVAGIAQIRYGHAFTPWIGASPDFPEWCGKTWVEQQKMWRDGKSSEK